MKVLVPGNTHNAYLDNLIPDTPYAVQVQAVYVDGDGPQVDGRGKTRESCWESEGGGRGTSSAVVDVEALFFLKNVLPSSSCRSQEHARV